MNPRTLPLWRRRLRHAHASLKDAATPTQVAQHMRRVLRAHRVHVITTTEAQRGDSRTTKALLPGYGAARAGGRMAVWKKKRLRLLNTPKYLRLTYVYAGDESWRDMHVTVFEFEDLANGLRYCFIVPHAAATVEHGDTWNAQNKLGIKSHTIGWPLVAALADKAEADGFEVVITGDSNLDQKRDAWREYLTEELERPSVFEGRVPKRGSHGRTFGRLIDIAHTRLRVVRAFVSKLRKRAPMDHGVIVMVYDLTAAIRRLHKSPTPPAPKKK